LSHAISQVLCQPDYNDIAAEEKLITWHNRRPMKSRCCCLFFCQNTPSNTSNIFHVSVGRNWGNFPQGIRNFQKF